MLNLKKIKTVRYLPIVLLIIFSCSSKKDILYIQDNEIASDFKLKFSDIKIKKDDILRIKISSKSVELANLFNFNNGDAGSNNLESYKINGYQVNSDGFVTIPLLNSVYVHDLTVFEASNLIQKLLRDGGLLTNASVDVKIINAYFTVLGEVNMPGRYNFLENNLDIFQALGIAGDLTINGQRNDVKILRKNDDSIKINSLDLTNSDIFNSQNFQIFPGDVIIVNANNARVKNAGVIGNFGNLLSVLSFILTSIVLISNN